MKIKRFIAKNMREAIRQVREEQGADAVILSNRRVNGGIEVVAAVDYDEALMQASLRRVTPQPQATAVAAPNSTPASTSAPTPAARREAATPAPSEPEPVADKFRSAAPPPPPAIAPRTSEALDLLLAEYGDEAAPAPVRTPMMRQAAAAAAGTSAAFAAAAAAQAGGAATPATVPADEFLALKRELGGMRRMIEQQLAGLAWNDLKHNRPQRLAVLRALADLGLEPELARSIADEMPEASGNERARFLPLGLLARRIPVTKPDVVLDGGIIALVGPTGVGKTTTIAKLAARFAERHGLRDIALVAMDHYRIGAQEQLYTYGRLLGVPVYTVTREQTLAQTLAKLGDRKLVLIDTVGMSPRDNALAPQIAMLNEAHPNLRAYLTMAATAQAVDQDEIVRRFGSSQLSGCILSKLDETTRIGGALSIAIRHGLPLAYVADGQRVPEDLQVANADQLVVRAMQLARNSPGKVDDEALAMQFTRINDAGAQANV